MAQTAAYKPNTEELFRRYRDAPSEELRNELAESYLYLAEILSHKYSNKGIDYEDLYQVAAYALLLAVERYDPDKGVQFASYATPTIIGEIKKHFRDTTWSLKVPRRLKEVSMRIPAAKARLQEKLHHIPTIAELADYMQISEEEVLEALESSKAYTAYSLEQETEDSADDSVPQSERYLGSIEEGYGAFELSAVLEKVMAGLSDTEKDIVRRRFLDETTQREAAQALGLSQMTVSRIEKALRSKFRREFSR